MKSWKRQAIIDVSIAVMVLLLPLLSFLHLLIPSNGDSIQLLGFGFAHGFADNQVFIWFLFMYISSYLFTLSIFLFSKGLWRFLLLPPLCYFVCYPIWVYHEESTYFSDPIFGLPGFLLMFFTVVVNLFLDDVVRKKLLKINIGLTFEAGCRELFEAWNSRYNREIRKTLQHKSDFSPREYLQRVYYYSSLADRMYGINPVSRVTSVRGSGVFLNLALGGLLLALLAVLFAHHWIPENETSSIVLGLEVGSFGFRDSSTFFFYASNKMVLCVLGLIWFATCRYWWRWAILSPVLFYLYQFWELFQSINDIDSTGNLKVLPLALSMAIVVAVLWKLIRSISTTRDYRQLLKLELDKNLEQYSRQEIQNKLMQIKVHNPEVLGAKELGGGKS